MKNKRTLRSIIAVILLSIMLMRDMAFLPSAALALDTDKTRISENIDLTEDYGAFPEKETVRDIAALKKDGSVVMSGDGSLVAIKHTEDSTLTGKEIDLLLKDSGITATKFTEKQLAQNLETTLATSYSLSKNQINKALEIHDDKNVFIGELINFESAKKDVNISKAREADILSLISSGYGSSQALAATVASGILNISIAELCEIKEAEIKEEREKIKAAEERRSSGLISRDEFSEEPADDRDPEILQLSIKMGAPYSVLEGYIKANRADIGKLDSSFAAACEKELTAASKTTAAPGKAAQANPQVNAQANVQMNAVAGAGSDSGGLLPKKVLEKPYSYDKVGDTEINLNSGAYKYTETDLYIPGKGGLDLTINRLFSSDDATSGAPVIVYNSPSSIYFEIGIEVYHYTNYGSSDQFTNPQLTRITNPGLYNYGNDAFIAPYVSIINSPVQISVANEEYALEFYNSFDPLSVVATRNGSTYIMEFRPYMKLVNNNGWSNFSMGSYTLNEYGLGQGWRLGFSSVESMLSTLVDLNASFYDDILYFNTADGKRYEIDRDQNQSTSSRLKGYQLTDMTFYLNGGGYNGAQYYMAYKDGKKEFFDSNGRIIAIRDRYNNTITFAYTYKAGTSNKVVEKITITDTLNNTIVYKNENINPAQYNLLVPSTQNSYTNQYNIKWTLSLNGTVVREYFSYNNTYSSNAYWGMTLLKGVKNESSELTRYSYYVLNKQFNCYSLESTTKDGVMQKTYISNIIYPNGLMKSLGTGYGTFGNRRLGGFGYEEYVVTTSYKTYYNYDFEGWYNTSYDTDRYAYVFDDYSELKPESFIKKYRGELTAEKNLMQIATVSAYPTPEFYGYYVNTVTYKFNSNLSTREELHRNLSTPVNDLKITTSAEAIAAFGKYFDTKLVTYTYGSDVFGRLLPLPASISVKEYNLPTDPATSSNSTPNRTKTYAYTYDGKGNVTSESAPNNQTTTYTYHATYNLPLTKTYKKDSATTVYITNTLTSDSKGIAQTTVKENTTEKQRTAYTYNSEGNLTNEKNYISASVYAETQYVYGNNAQITETKRIDVRDVNGTLVTGSPGYAAGILVEKVSYNSRYWPVTQTDANGNVTAIGYDATGRITSVTSPDGGQVTYAYNVAGNKVVFTDELNNVTEYRYDPVGNLSQIFDVTGNRPVKTMKYDSMHRLILDTEHTGTGTDKITYYLYDTFGRVIESGSKSGGALIPREKYSYYDAQGITEKIVVGGANAPDMKTRTYTDIMGYVTKVGYFLGVTENFDYYTNNYLGSVTEERTQYTVSRGESYTNRYTYDFAGRVLTAVNALGQTASGTYDWLGRVLTQTDYSGGVTTNTYDKAGRLLETQSPFSKVGSTTYYSKAQYTYDRNGSAVLQKVTNSAPGAAATYAQTGYSYDANNRLLSAVSYNGSAAANYTQYYYDQKGNILRMYTGLSSPLTISGLDTVSGADANYSVTRYAYDHSGNLISVTDGLGQSEYMTYNTAGRITGKTDRNGNVTAYTYNDRGQLLSAATVTPDGDGSVTLSYTYSNNGAALTESNGAITASYTYDSYGRVINENVDGVFKSYTYNLGGGRTGLSVVQGSQLFNTTYTYDALLRMTGMSESGVTAAYGYDTNGNRSYVQYNNGLREEYAYNLANLLTAVTNKNSAGTALSGYTYEYRLDGNQTKKTENTGKITTYSYDYMGRLSVESESVSGQTQSYSYLYDDYGNRSTMTASGTESYVTDYAYDMNSRLLSEVKTEGGSVDTTLYFYDPNGNQISKTTERLSSGGSSEITLSEEVETAEYIRYNGINQVVETKLGGNTVTYAYNPAGIRISKTVNGVATQFVLDGGSNILERTGGVTTAKYVRGINLVASVTGGGTSYYLYNGHGDVVQLTNAAGAVTRTYDYDAFGNEKQTEQVPIAPSGSLPESEHPYANNLDQTWTYAYPVAADSLNVTFSSDTKVENSYDKIYIADGSGNPVAGSPFTSTQLAGKTISVPGNTVKIRLTTDSSVVYYGFRVTDITAVNPAALGAPGEDPNPYRYAGEYFDRETGTYYLRARYYDPAIGRFTSEDPIRDGVNWYTYCGNNPVRFVDANGMKPVPVFTGAFEYIRKLLFGAGSDMVLYDYSFTTAMGAQILEMKTDGSGVYHANFDCWQAAFGYNNFYDNVFDTFTSMERAKFEFSSGGKDYVLWAWKGDYLNLGAGAELGIYKKSTIPGQWDVDKSLALPMSMSLKYTDPKNSKTSTLFTYNPSDPQWWITGFNPSYQSVKADDLTAAYTVDFSGNKDMYNDFYNKWGQGKIKDDRWTFDPKTYTATFKF